MFILVSGAGDLKPYKDKAWLDEQINALGKTQAQVAKECGVSDRTISYWFNIDVQRTKRREYLDKNKEKNKAQKKAYNLEYRDKNKKKLAERDHERYVINAKKIKTNAKIYREKNREKIKIKDKARHKIYRENNKEKVKESIKRWYENNKERALNRTRKWRESNRERSSAISKSYRKRNKEKISELQKVRAKKEKRQALEVLGGCICKICGVTNLNFLTIDHIDSSGYLDKKNGLYASTMYRAIVKGTIKEEKLNNLRVLCYNHNCSRSRGYLDLPRKDQTRDQRRQAKLWKEAFAFFGPCHCGISELKFLTISHIHNDGAERRKKGEKKGSALLAWFRAQGWPESLKKKFCLECFNCNCSRGNREE